MGPLRRASSKATAETPAPASAEDWRGRAARDRPDWWPLPVLAGGVGAILTTALWGIERWGALQSVLAGVSTVLLWSGWLGLNRLIVARRVSVKGVGTSIVIFMVVGLGLVIVDAVVWQGWARAAVVCVSLVVPLAIAGLLLRNGDVAFDVAAIVALLSVAATLVWFIVAISQPAYDIAWLQVAVLAVGAGVALFLAAIDWSRTALIITTIVIIIVAVTYLTRLGYRSELEARFDEPALVAIDEFERLSQADSNSADPDGASPPAGLVEERDGAIDEAALAIGRLTDPGYREVAADALTEIRAIPIRVGTGADEDPSTGLIASAETSLQRLFVTQIPADTATAADPARTALVAAFDAAVAVVEFKPVPTQPFEAAVRAFCDAASESEVRLDACTDPSGEPAASDEVEAQQSQPSAEPVGNDAPDEGAGQSLDESQEEAASQRPSLGTTLSRMELELARYRALVEPSDENTALLTAAASSQSDPTNEIEVLTALAAAPETVIDSIDADRGTRLVPGLFTWLIVLGILAGYFRWLFRVNARQGPGPVTISPTDGVDATHAAAFTVAVLSNVATPDAAPGQVLGQSLTGLSTVSTATKGVFEALAAGLNIVTGRKRGFDVTLAVAPTHSEPDPSKADEPPTQKDPDSPAGRFVVLVRVLDASSQRVVGSKQYPATAEVTATVERAGRWAAGRVLAESSRIPSWAGWTEDNIDAIEIIDRTGGAEDDLERLARAARIAPTSGIVLQQYQRALKAAKQPDRAVVVAARAVALHPRHLAARNALALRLLELSSSWSEMAVVRRRSVADAVDLALGRLGIRQHIHAANPDRVNLEIVCNQIWHSVRQDVGPWRRLSATLRRRDRSSAWLEWRLGSVNSASATDAITQTLMLDGRTDKDTRRSTSGAEIQELTTLTLATRGSSILAFNLACTAGGRLEDDVESSAETSVDEDAALLWLDRMFLFGDVSGFDRNDLENEPYLHKLKPLSGFQNVIEQFADPDDEGDRS